MISYHDRNIDDLDTHSSSGLQESPSVINI